MDKFINKSTSQLLSEGVKKHAAGALSEAIVIYEKLISRQPKNADALYLLGTAYLQIGRLNEGIEKLCNALKVNPSNADALYNRASAYFQSSQYDYALVDADRLISIDSKNISALSLKVHILHKLLRLRDALTCVDGVLKLVPSDWNMLFTKGVLLGDMGLHHESKGVLLELIESNSHHPDIYNELGILSMKIGDQIKAIEYFDGCIKLMPESYAAHRNKGNAYFALEWFDSALISYKEAIKINPNYAAAYSSISNVLLRMGNYEDAIQFANSSIGLEPNSSMAHNDLGVLYLKICSIDSAISSFNKSIELDVLNPEPYFNKSQALLLSGNFEQGWRLFEYRWETLANKAFKPNLKALPLTYLDDIKNKTILLQAEQGFGDTIQFSRYVAMVVDLGAHVILQVPKVLRALFLWLEESICIISDDDELPKFDYFCPLMTLPLIFNTNLDEIPDVNFGYVVDECKRTHWVEKIGIKTKTRVGIAWSGNPSHTNDHNRSIDLSDFMGFMPNDFEFISLQKNIKDRDLDVVQLNQIKHFGTDLKDFTDTATLCDLVDVVISVDTSVAHLSASMQKPTWVLLPFSPDWRWLLNRDDSPWYPSVKLYRQTSLGDWKTVLNRISTDLSKLKGI